MGVLGLLLLLQLAPSAPGATEYVVDAKESALLVVTHKDSKAALAAAAHDHAIHATELEGKISYDPSSPETCGVKIVVPVAGLRADEPEMRRRAGLKGEPLAKNRDDVREAMLDEDQLDAKQYPTITFQAKKCTAAGSGAIQVTGDLTVRGRTKTLTVDMKIKLEGKTLSARGKFTATHADFGFKPYSAALGTIRNAEELTFLIDVKGTAP